MSRSHPERLFIADLVGWWAPVVVWVVFILVASGDFFSSNHTGSWLSVLLGFVSVAPGDRFEAVNLMVRKTAHLVEYGVLGFLAYRAFHCTWRDWAADRCWMSSVALVVACSMTDELHQSTIASRTGSFRDVVVDTTGALLGMYLFCRLIARRRGRDVSATEHTALDSELDA
jgi:VanZ family protein